MQRQRRRRIATQCEIASPKKNENTDSTAMQRAEDVQFMQEVNYKLELKEAGQPTDMIRLRTGACLQEERRQAFKKKLRKYSHLMQDDAFMELE